jgi:hypothetical protein
MINLSAFRASRVPGCANPNRQLPNASLAAGAERRVPSPIVNFESGLPMIDDRDPRQYQFRYALLKPSVGPRGTQLT